MTREEAIANLKTIMFAYIEPPPTKEQIKIINDTFDMAIKALSEDAYRKWKYCPNCGAKMAESEEK